MASKADFLISGQPSSQRGYTGTHGEVLVLRLENLPAVDVRSVTFRVSDRRSVGAPSITFAGSGTEEEQAATTSSEVQIQLPGTGIHTYVLQCEVVIDTNSGPSVVVFERAVSIFSGALRKWVSAEQIEFYSDGWFRDQNAMVDAIAGGGGGGGVLAGNVTGTLLDNTVERIRDVVVSAASFADLGAGNAGRALSWNGTNIVAELLTDANISDTAAIGAHKIAGVSVRAPVKAAGSISVPNGAATVDGYSPTDGERVLALVCTSDQTQRGIWIYNSGGAWTRPLDFDSSADAAPMTLIPVERGSTNNKRIFKITNDSVTLGSTVLTFADIDSDTTLTPPTGSGGEVPFHDGAGNFSYTGAPTPGQFFVAGALIPGWADVGGDVTGPYDDLVVQAINDLPIDSSAFGTPTDGYVAAVVSGQLSLVDPATFSSQVVDWKDSVRLATTADHALSGLAAIDDVTPNEGDRILVWQQSTASQNGFYNASSGAWTRTGDFDEDAEVTAGAATIVTEGTLHGGKLFKLGTADPIVVGTTALTFSAISTATPSWASVLGVGATSGAHTPTFEQGANFTSEISIRRQTVERMFSTSTTTDLDAPSGGAVNLRVNNSTILGVAASVITAQTTLSGTRFIAALASGYSWGSSVVTPIIQQAAATSGAGNSLRVFAQNTNDATEAAGNLELRHGLNSGAGPDGSTLVGDMTSGAFINVTATGGVEIGDVTTVYIDVDDTTGDVTLGDPGSGTSFLLAAGGSAELDLPLGEAFGVTTNSTQRFSVDDSGVHIPNDSLFFGSSDEVRLQHESGFFRVSISGNTALDMLVSGANPILRFPSAGTIGTINGGAGGLTGDGRHLLIVGGVGPTSIAGPGGDVILRGGIESPSGGTPGRVVIQDADGNDGVYIEAGISIVGGGFSVDGPAGGTCQIVFGGDEGFAVDDFAGPTLRVGFFGERAERPAAYTVTNDVEDRTYDANSTTTAELADVVGTIIADLQAYGLFQ